MALKSISPTEIDRDDLRARYRANRERSKFLFDLIHPDAYYSRPIPLRHPFAFYEGHLPAFSFLTLNERALGESPVDARLEKLFERGIDPGSLEAAAQHERADWPTRADIQTFGKQCDERVDAALASATLIDAQNPRLVRGESAYNIIEHELMHHETLMYIIHQLDPAHKERIEQQHEDHAPPRNDFVHVAAGEAILGADHDEIPFGWDNEFETVEMAVPEFSIQRFPVTNKDYLEFAHAGGEVPAFWIRRGEDFKLRGAFEELPFAGSWPVYVTHRQAEAYAKWKGWRLPSEAQYHRAAFGDPSGEQRPFPWGTQVPTSEFGNFDFKRYDPMPVDAHPRGASAWGIHDLIGNGWEWTSSVFGPFDGFKPMASYPQYSADFFDGKHYVMKGASPVTSAQLVRRSFRNWFYDDYPYMYAKFRCVR